MRKKFKPFFKWSGGKRREFDTLVKYLPDDYDVFYEPFLGGGAVWLGMACDKNVVGDLFGEVISFYRIIKEHGKDFIEDVNKFSDEYNKLIKGNVLGAYSNEIDKKNKELKLYKKGDPSYKKTKDEIKKLKALARGEFKPCADLYYEWRSKDPTTDYEIAKRFYILRCLSYGGMLRFNSSGKFNVPYGYYKSFKSLSWENGIEELLANTEFHCAEWQKTLQNSKKNDFVFLDPPYTRKFQEYSAGNTFGKKEHIKLAEWFKSKKSKAMIILNKDDFTESLYGDFIVTEYPITYSVKYRDRLTKKDASTMHFIAINY